MMAASTPSLEASRGHSARGIAAAKTYRNRQDWEQRAFEVQLQLFEPAVHPETLLASTKILTKKHYRDIVSERSSEKTCGYPLCSSPTSKAKGRFRISRSHLKIYDMAELKDYCSPDCLTASEYFVSQMSEEPPYLRVRDPVIELWTQSLAPGSEMMESTQHAVVPAMPVDTVALADQLIANYASSVSVLPEILSNLHIQEKSASIGALDMEAIQKSSPNAAEFTSSLDRKVVGLPQPIPIGTIPSLEEESSMDIQIAPAVEPKELPNANNRQDDDQTLSVGSQTPRNSDSEDEDGMETDGSDADWLSPNMLERPKLTLSFFGKIWTFLDRMITPQTKVWVQSPARHNDLPLSLDSQDIARLELFSKRILTTYNSMRRKYGLKLVLTNDLLGLLKTIRLLDSAVVLSSDEDWALCTVFLNVLSQTSEPIANEFESKWSDILAQVNLSTAELAVFTKAFL